MTLFKDIFPASNASMEQEFLKNSFGAIIKAARLKKGLTQYELADASGVRRRFIQGVENGHHEAKISTLFGIAKALDTSPMSLIGELEYAMAHGCLPTSVLDMLPPRKIGRPKKDKENPKK